MSTIVENVTCTFCGCLCDDITVEVEDRQIIRVRRVCANGRGVFADYDATQKKPTIAGREVSWKEAVAEAAKLLVDSDNPLIYGLSSTAVEAQRKAVELADQLGAVIDTTSSVCHGPTGLAMQAVGEPSCTLGEVRNRADPDSLLGLQPGCLASAAFQPIFNNVQGHAHSQWPQGSHRICCGCKANCQHKGSRPFSPAQTRLRLRGVDIVASIGSGGRNRC